MHAGGAEIAVATLALRQLVGDALASVPGAVTVLEPPRAGFIPPAPTVGLFLFHVDLAPLPSAAPPPRRPDGVVPERTRTLGLDYVIYFSGDRTRCEPEILLALVAGALEATPVVDPAAGVAAFHSMHPSLEAPAGIAAIRVTPLMLSGMDRAALWSRLSTPYQLSVEYRAHVLPL